MTATVDIWASHFGFTSTPFTKSVPADKLFERSGTSRGRRPDSPLHRRIGHRRHYR
jgi:hypothetical protein